MLAIKTVLADEEDTPTLIFDEIDSGISGITAGRVGERLQLIGKSRQALENIEGVKRVLYNSRQLMFIFVFIKRQKIIL